MIKDCLVALIKSERVVGALIRKKLALVIIRRAVYLKIMKRAFLFTHRILHLKKFSEVEFDY